MTGIDITNSSRARCLLCIIFVGIIFRAPIGLDAIVVFLAETDKRRSDDCAGDSQLQHQPPWERNRSMFPSKPMHPILSFGFVPSDTKFTTGTHGIPRATNYKSHRRGRHRHRRRRRQIGVAGQTFTGNRHRCRCRRRRFCCGSSSSGSARCRSRRSGRSSGGGGC